MIAGSEFHRGSKLWKAFASYDRRRIAAIFNPQETHSVAYYYLTVFNVVITPRGGVYDSTLDVGAAAMSAGAIEDTFRSSVQANELYHVTCEGMQQDNWRQRPAHALPIYRDVVILTHRHEVSRVMCTVPW